MNREDEKGRSASCEYAPVTTVSFMVCDSLYLSIYSHFDIKKEGKTSHGSIIPTNQVNNYYYYYHRYRWCHRNLLYIPPCLVNLIIIIRTLNDGFTKGEKSGKTGHVTVRSYTLLAELVIFFCNFWGSFLKSMRSYWLK